MIEPNNEQIRPYARQLKVPTFASYADTFRQCSPDADFSSFLLELMRTDAASRQENRTRRAFRLRHFPLRRRWMTST